MTDEQWQRWLRQSAPEERVLLIELQNSHGPVYLANRPYTSHPGDPLPDTPFRDALTDSLEIDDDDALGLGDLEFVWPGRIAGLRAAYWRGYPWRSWLGAADWPMRQFRLINGGYIDSVQRTARDRLKVLLAGYGLALVQPVTIDLSGTAQSVMTTLCTQCGLPAPVFRHFFAEQLAMPVQIDATETELTCYAALNTVAESVGAIIYSTVATGICIARLDHQRSPDKIIRDDDVVRGSVRELGEIRALSALTVSYQQGDEMAEVRADNQASPYPQGWLETLTVHTVLTQQQAAQRRLEQLSQWRFKRRLRYSMTLLVRGADIRRGDRVHWQSGVWGMDAVATVTGVRHLQTSGRFALELVL